MSQPLVIIFVVSFFFNLCYAPSISSDTLSQRPDKHLKFIKLRKEKVISLYNHLDFLMNKLDHALARMHGKRASGILDKIDQAWKRILDHEAYIARYYDSYWSTLPVPIQEHERLSTIKTIQVQAKEERDLLGHYFHDLREHITTSCWRNAQDISTISKVQIKKIMHQESSL